jgi:hypothetical protein
MLIINPPVGARTSAVVEPAAQFAMAAMDYAPGNIGAKAGSTTRRSAAGVKFEDFGVKGNLIRLVGTSADVPLPQDVHCGMRICPTSGGNGAAAVAVAASRAAN